MTDDKTMDKTTDIRTMDTQAMPTEQAAAEQAAADKGFDDSRNHSLQDIVDTQAMPAPAGVKPDVAPPTEQVLDKPIPTVDQNADTAVFAEAAVGTEATTKTDPAAKDDTTQPVATPPVDLNTPLTRLMGVSDEPEPEAKPEPAPPKPAAAPSAPRPAAPAQPAGGARPAAPVPATIAPTGPSVPTILLGAVGILVGAFGLLLGLRLPDVTAWMFGIDPQTLTALFFGGIGVVLILVAIIWAIAKAITGRRNQ
ncbi:hypothetical protein [Bifidobacterium parmae]|uniref:Uncharacterized protein n=1 Tax=Bifidobacterium parmae TaxID=361854 RepID=A0A2N5J641_9BIFI|nr:hypothetical protein [Bifidobacterium parmae]PLS29681.1 hypothetical protein Uis4E_0022 [Bifidobacterium parmae]